jgi:type I restriction enzyme, S subunit
MNNKNSYLKYSKSEVPWIDKIPSHWKFQRNGALFKQRNETGFSDLPILEVSLRTGVRIRDFEGSKRKQIMSDSKKYKGPPRGISLTT